MGDQAVTPRIKVCGITSVDDALLAVDAGVNLLGLNFVATSPRVIHARTARDIVAAVGSLVEIIGVVANRSVSELRELRHTVGVHAWQLHGDEPPDVLASLSEADFKAVRVAALPDVELARTYPGRRLLVDAKVEGVLGGSGHTFDWSLVQELARERELLLAGGITPDNVGAAIRSIAPWGIDTASGVELAPGKKDPVKVRALVARVWEASRH